ncbi:MAG: hypothetical protein ABI876_06665, partial [Bacteroidota bacterium]
VSPYNIPQSIRVAYNPQSGLFKLEIEYIIKDSKTSKVDVRGIEFVIGKHSGRLYQMSTIVPLERRRAPGTAVIEQLEEALETIKEMQPDNGRRDSYNITRSIIDANSRNLFSNVAVAG